VWRCHPNQLYAVEVTRPNRENIPQSEKGSFPESRTLALLDLLPSVSCLGPRATIGHSPSQQQGMHLNVYSDYITGMLFMIDHVLMDDEEFKGASYQRVYQYIRRYTAGQNLDTFSYAGEVEGRPQDCAEQLLR
jgi:hypothetical protein